MVKSSADHVTETNEADGVAAFIEKHSTYTLDEMLATFKEVGEGSVSLQDISFLDHLEELFAKGVCSNNNQWMPKVECL